MGDVGRIGELWRYPVKSMQGRREPSVEVGPAGIVGDRRWALIDEERGRVLSAKRAGALLSATGGDGTAELPDGTSVTLGDGAGDVELSRWLGRRVVARTAQPEDRLQIEMTFDPPNDDAEYYDIPIAEGSFLDLAPVHVITTATLAACAEARPDLDWDVRRFRPNVVVECDGPAFVEDTWVGQELVVGAVRLRVDQATVRCAMPLRAQVDLSRQPELHQALNELNVAMPNHLGVYASVVTPGLVAVGDAVVVLP